MGSGDDLTLEAIKAFLRDVGERHPEPATLYLIGGGALRFLGSARATLDLDYVGPDIAEPQDALRTTVNQVAAAHRIEVEAVPLDQFIPLPIDAEKRHHRVGQYSSLTVYVFDPYSIALSKLDRGFESDLQDIRFLVRHGYITLESLERYAVTMMEEGTAYLIDPAGVREHLAALRQLL